MGKGVFECGSEEEEGVRCGFRTRALIRTKESAFCFGRVGRVGEVSVCVREKGYERKRSVRNRFGFKGK